MGSDLEPNLFELDLQARFIRSFLATRGYPDDPTPLPYRTPSSPRNPEQNQHLSHPIIF